MKLLLHICCGPCATASIKKLQEDSFDVVGFYYNPNIHPSSEYKKRLKEAKKLADNLKIDLIIPNYNPREYFEATGTEPRSFDCSQDDTKEELSLKLSKLKFPKPAERCPRCWELRLKKTAEMACDMGIEHFGTTLRISPYQDQGKLLELGKKIAKENKLIFYEEDLESCFHDSVEMSKEQGMYRQKYCGCTYSRDYR